MYDGVYVDHTGPMTWVRRAWAAVLFAWPACLCSDSAIRATDGPGDVVGHRLGDLEEKALWNTCPPRLRLEEAVLDVAARKSSDFDAISALADAVQSRRTTVPRLLEALRGRTRIARRQFLEEVPEDVGEGACSALEHACLTRVERALLVCLSRTVSCAHPAAARRTETSSIAISIVTSTALWMG